MEAGTQIAYFPHQAYGAIDHPAVEFGFVVRMYDDDHALCRFWRKDARYLGERLRTTSSSEMVETRYLRVIDSVPQFMVDNAMEEFCR